MSLGQTLNDTICNVMYISLDQIILDQKVKIAICILQIKVILLVAQLVEHGIVVVNKIPVVAGSNPVQQI
jgi:hypothetical protein